MLSFLGFPFGSPKKLNIFKGSALHFTSKSRMGNVAPENMSGNRRVTFPLTKAALFSSAEAKIDIPGSYMKVLVYEGGLSQLDIRFFSSGLSTKQAEFDPFHTGT